jgi:hypothetical protein
MEPKKKLKVFDNFKTKKKPSEDDLRLPRFGGPVMYRYLMEFPLDGVMYEALVNCELPSASIVNHNSMNFFGSTSQWNPIQVKISDTFFNYGDKQEFYSKLRSWFTGLNKINTTISRIDPTGLVVSRWDLRGCFVSNIYYGTTFDYGDEPELEITLHYDYCNLNYYDI